MCAVVLAVHWNQFAAGFLASPHHQFAAGYQNFFVRQPDAFLFANRLVGRFQPLHADDG